MAEDYSATDFMAAVESMVTLPEPQVTATGAAILLAVHRNIAADSRSIANRLGLAHALLLREISQLSPRFISVTKRDTRTQRSFLELTTEGAALAASPPGI